jgi:hypothetical protein
MCCNGLQNFQAFIITDLLVLGHIDETLKRDLRQSVSFEPSYACFLQRSVRPVTDCWKKASIQKSRTVVILLLCVEAPLSNLLQLKLAYLLRSSMQAVFTVLTMQICQLLRSRQYCTAKHNVRGKALIMLQSH